MKKRRDIHGIMNSLMGVIIASVCGFYLTELPVLVIIMSLIVSSFLIYREYWMYGEGARWSITRDQTRDD